MAQQGGPPPQLQPGLIPQGRALPQPAPAGIDAFLQGIANAAPQVGGFVRAQAPADIPAALQVTVDATNTIRDRVNALPRLNMTDQEKGGFRAYLMTGLQPPMATTYRSIKEYALLPDIGNFCDQFTAEPSLSMGTIALAMVIFTAAGMIDVPGSGLITRLRDGTPSFTWTFGGRFADSFEPDSPEGAFIQGFSMDSMAVFSDFVSLIACDQVKPLSPQNVQSFFAASGSVIPQGTVIKFIKFMGSKCERLMEDPLIRMTIRAQKWGQYHSVVVSSPGLVLASRPVLMALRVLAVPTEAALRLMMEDAHHQTCADAIPDHVIGITSIILEASQNPLDNWYQGNSKKAAMPISERSRYSMLARQYFRLSANTEQLRDITTMAGLMAFVEGNEGDMENEIIRASIAATRRNFRIDAATRGSRALGGVVAASLEAAANDPHGHGVFVNDAVNAVMRDLA